MIDHTPEEDEAFNELERQSGIKLEILRHPSKEAVLATEVALLTRLVRDLADRVRELESRHD